MDKFLKDFKRLSLSSIIFCNLQNNFGSSNLSGKTDTEKKPDGNNNDKKEETPEQKKKKELEQFSNKVNNNLKESIKIKREKVISLNESKKNTASSSIFDDNINLEVKPKIKPKNEEWFTYNSIYDFTDKLKEFCTVVNNENLDPSNGEDNEKLKIVYDNLIKTTITELEKHLNFNPNNVSKDIVLVNLITFDVNNMTFKDFYINYLDGFVNDKTIYYSYYNLINNSSSIELYLDDNLKNEFFKIVPEMTRSTAKIKSKDFIFAGEIVKFIEEYRKTKFRLKNDVDIIYDSNEFIFCNFGPNLINADNLDVDEVNWKYQGGKAKLNYLNKLIEKLIGKENVLTEDKSDGTPKSILKQLEPHFNDKIKDGKYRLMLKTRLITSDNLGYILLRDKTTSPS